MLNYSCISRLQASVGILMNDIDPAFETTKTTWTIFRKSGIARIGLDRLPLHLESIKPSDWEQLYTLTESIYQTKNFGERIDYYKDEISHMVFPRVKLSSQVSQFLKTLFRMELVVAFYWANWERGKNILQGRNQDYRRFDSVTLCKLLTTIVRTDQVNEGFLLKHFEEETVRKIVTELVKKIKRHSLKK